MGAEELDLNDKFSVYAYDADALPYIDPQAKVHSSAQIHAGVKIWAFASVHEGVVLEENVVVGEHVYIGREARIGRFTRISQGVHLCDHLVCGANVFIGPGVCVVNDRHPSVFKSLSKTAKIENPWISRDVVIGTGAIILPGVRLEWGCTVGAGAVVTRNVPSGMTVVGNPARIMKGKRDAVRD